MNSMNLRRGRTLSVCLLAFAVSGLLPAILSAQAGATGSIEGRVRAERSGRYLNNARITVEGTGMQTLTNDFGEFRLNGVPAGEVTVNVFFTGLQLGSERVSVTPGGVARADFALRRTGDLDPDDEEFILLEDFRVDGGARAADAVALQEQRFAPNIMNVASADQFGDVTEGNVGEFIKYLPGISVEYVAADVRSISVRGFGDNFTGVTVDGNRMASAASGAHTRRFELEQVSINNVSRIEVSKVPTPDVTAASLGGNVNLVSKSAFERDRREIDYRAYISANSESLSLNRTPGPDTHHSRKVRGGFDLNYIDPISDHFGIALNALHSDQFNEQHRAFRVWEADTGDGASEEAPYLRTFEFQDGPKETLRQSVGGNFDWRPAPNWLVSFGAQWNKYDSFFGNRNLNLNTGSNPDSYTPDSVNGRAGAGALRHRTSFRNKHGRTIASNLDVSYRTDGLKVSASLYYSDSEGKYDDIANGYFELVETAGLEPVTINFAGVGSEGPENISVTNAEGDFVDFTNLQNFEVRHADSRPIDSSDRFEGGTIDVEKNFDGFTLQAGVLYENQKREVLDTRTRYTPNERFNAALIRDNVYIGEEPGFNQPRMQWPDPERTYQRYLADPGAWDVAYQDSWTPADRDILLEETISALYLMGHTRFADNRLHVLGGVRWERTKFEGEGPLVTGSGDAMEIIRRGNHVSGSYDDFFPSIHFVYDITPNLLARAAYAYSFGRPNWSELVPRITINESEQTPGSGSVSAINGNLEPWYADNFDVSLEYYLEDAGVISGGFFYKKVKNGFQNFSTTLNDQLINELDLGAYDILQSGEWTVTTTTNGGSAEIYGFEANFQHSLAFAGGWGEHFRVHANATLLELKGSDDFDFSNFVERTYNWGVTFERGPLEVMLKWNYRGEQQLEPRSNEFEGGQRWWAARLYTDVNVEYELHRSAVLFINARNIFNEPQTRQNYSSITPGYARDERVEDYGVQLAIGIKGRF